MSIARVNLTEAVTTTVTSAKYVDFFTIVIIVPFDMKKDTNHATYSWQHTDSGERGLSKM